MTVLTDHISFFQTKWAAEFAASGDSCIVKEQTGESFNETTGQTEPTYTNRYSGDCLVRDTSARAAEFGEALNELRRYEVHIPYDSSALEPGFLVDITSTRDADLNGITVVVKSVGKDTWNVVKTLTCEENQSA